MNLGELLAPERVVLNVRAHDKAELLAEAARLLANAAPAIPPAAIEAALLLRETLGSTGLGHGFALPHARLDALASYHGLFLRLGRPIDFDAIDGKPVDLVFVLLIPPETATPHVSVLAAITRRFRDAARVTALRRAETPSAALALMATGPMTDP